MTSCSQKMIYTTSGLGQRPPKRRSTHEALGNKKIDAHFVLVALLYYEFNACVEVPCNEKDVNNFGELVLRIVTTLINRQAISDSVHGTVTNLRY